jgi:formylmethanofuran dehydrogenase subunit E
VRVTVREDSRERAWRYAPDACDKREAQMRAYVLMPDEELFMARDVVVTLQPEDMPGPPAFRATCEQCGERVNDGRQVEEAGRVLCRACAHGAYYTPVKDSPGVKGPVPAGESSQ